MNEKSNVSMRDASIENVPSEEDNMPMAGLCLIRMLAPGNGSWVKASFTIPAMEAQGCAWSNTHLANTNNNTSQRLVTVTISF
jgi:hypothetical protein